MNIAEILKDCPKGTKLYSTVYGEVYFKYIQKNSNYPIIVEYANECPTCFTPDGKMFNYCDGGECVLFPSKENRDWSTFKVPKKEYEFKPFDKVLVRDCANNVWQIDLFAYTITGDYKYRTMTNSWRQCIPFEGNEHLLGTTNHA